MKLKRMTINCILPAILQSILFSNIVLAWKKDGYIEKDFFTETGKGKMSITKMGTCVNITEKDSFNKDRTNIYNPNGQKQGYLKQDYFHKDRTNVYGQSGSKVDGYYKKIILNRAG